MNNNQKIVYYESPNRLANSIVQSEYIHYVFKRFGMYMCVRHDSKNVDKYMLNKELLGVFDKTSTVSEIVYEITY